MTEGIINATIKKLKRDLEQMDIPQKRKGDLRWLERNLYIKNNNDKAREAMWTIRVLINNGITNI